MQLTKVKNLPAVGGPGGDVLTLYPISDLHVGSPAFDEPAFRNFLEARIGNDPNARFVFNGDGVEALLPTSKPPMWDQALKPGDQRDRVIQLLKPHAAKCLGATSGNHDQRVYKVAGVDICKDIAEALGVPYDPIALLLWLPFHTPHGKKAHKRGPDVSYTVYVTHGWSGGRTPGAVVNQFVEVGKVVVSDIYILGHSHNQWAHPDEISLPDLNRGRVIQQRRYYVMAGAWLRYEGYAQAKGYRQPTMGAPAIRLGMRHKEISIQIS